MAVQWELLFFSLLVGLGMGCFAFVAVTEWLGKLESIRLPGAITSIICLGIGGIISALHLGHPERVFHILGNIKSGIAQEFILSAVAGGLIALYIVLLLWQGASAKARKNVAILGLVAAVLLVFSTGNLYVLGARPAWSTFILPVLYVAMAAPLGVFAMYIWLVQKGENGEVIQQVNKVAFYGLVAFAVMVISYVIYLFAAPFPDPTRSPLRLLAGDLTILFWGAVVLVGLITPMLVTFRTMQGPSGNSLLTVPVTGLMCVLVGSVGMRAIVYLLGTSVHRFIVG